MLFPKSPVFDVNESRKSEWKKIIKTQKYFCTKMASSEEDEFHFVLKNLILAKNPKVLWRMQSVIAWDIFTKELPLSGRKWHPIAHLLQHAKIKLPLSRIYSKIAAFVFYLNKAFYFVRNVHIKHKEWINCFKAALLSFVPITMELYSTRRWGLVSGQVVGCSFYDNPTSKNTQNTSFTFDYWADSLAHFLLLKICMQ